MKTYIGDGCYVDFDGFALVLTTENGISTTNRIILEPEVYAAFVAFVDRLRDGTAPITAGERQNIDDNEGR